MPTRDEMASHAAIQSGARHLRDISETLDRFALLYEWRQLKSIGPGQRIKQRERVLELEAQLWPSNG